LAGLLAVPATSAAAPRTIRGDTGLSAAVAPTSQLDRTREVRSLGVRYRRYRQVVGGLPVLGSDVVVTDAPGRRNDALVDATRRIAPPKRATVRRAAAIRVARARVGASRLRRSIRASRAILPGAGDAADRIVWRVIVARARPIGSFEVLVDARSGRVVRVSDLLRHETAAAKIFDPNPVVFYGTSTGLLDASDADSTALTNARVDVTLQRLPASLCLDGPFVHVTLPSDTEVCTTSDFNGITRADDRFEALMSYYHLDREQVYVQSLGFTNVNNRVQRVNADAVLPGGPSEQDNSFYEGGSREIFVGTGGVDDGEDAEVLMHEYGHAMQDDQVPGFANTGLEAQAIGEGFSDYISAAMVASLPPDTNPQPALVGCLAEWDSVGFGAPVEADVTAPCLRRMDKHLTLAQAKSDTLHCDSPAIDEHCLGEAWSNALWDMRQHFLALDSIDGGKTADRLVIQSNFGLSATASFQQASENLMNTDRFFNSGAHVNYLRSLLIQRGLYNPENADDLPGGATPLAIPSSRTGALTDSSDNDDVYAVQLVAGRGYVFRLRGTAGDFDLKLLRPGSTSLASNNVVAAAQTGSSNENIAYTAPVSGRFFLDATVFSGSGPYTVSALPDTDRDARPDSEDNCVAKANAGQEDSDADRIGDACDRFPDDPRNDQDGDGRGADSDNCPTKKNPSQADWDADDHGDVCDRSSRVTLKRLRLRGSTLTLRATLRPGLLGKRSVAIRIERRACSTCRFKKLSTVRRERNRGKGRVDVKVRVRSGRNYRARAFLKDRRYRSATSRSVRLSGR
jgi:thrombospondin type 3 repeat protein/pre-peptidase/fungalysin metallopeptidase (M36)/fungalysin/thermolysin propeptide